jgi:DNA-binding response OmpR family regulator
MNGCILVVEHDPATRHLFAGNLKDAGYRVFCADRNRPCREDSPRTSA